ncbi:helix-turn-helix domain-containing protein [Mesorhizobium sp. M7A.F.Ca.MR.148.00.0.0]|uniref:helix-turn-helix domain-containing protein n=1 Tax=Mesorhizobium sp. M7A.F.Ca.MR.148.00.0.0 TaxID=2496775 RepID=UPI000FCBE266|nr:helix-turn-helix domain-containing protein [Mesorhizobium sp. M7A.F.Ca.MR.148.00.0.0]RUV37428.1 hypothetical protein EOB49_11755 [Mesorhizobium sp. M7A.F.Ca.MR.148.00.0.0]
MIKTKSSVKEPTAKPKAVPAKSKPEAGPKKKPARGKKKPASKAKPPVEPKPAAQPAPKPEPAPQPKPDEAHKGGASPKLTARDVPRVIAMLRQCGGIKTVAAERLNVGRTTLYAFLNEHPEIQEADSQISEELLDVAEGQVVIALRSGDMQTVRWYLELKGKDRGFVRRVETTGKNGGPVETAQKLDLANMSDEELEILLRAAEKRESTAGGK